MANRWNARGATPFAGLRPENLDPERLLVVGLRGLAPHVRAPAQELLDLALVGVRAVVAAEDRVEPEVLPELDRGLSRRIAVVESRRLVLAIVESPAEAKLVH